MKKVGKIVASLFAAVMVFGIFQLSASASDIQVDLTQQQKEEYYKQYAEIITEVNSEQSEADLELVPFDKVTDWFKPDEFREIAKERATLQFVYDVKGLEATKPTKGLSALGAGTASATKSKGFNARGTSVTLSVTGIFYTEYYDLYKRQLFSGIKSVSSRSNKGSWSQSGWEYTSMDMGTTYSLTTSGRLEYNNITSSHHVAIEFYCTATGGVE
ncbi:hypothetical protein ACQKMD_11840 [Viridibacillus sp. NPDC096237]|uniref:hypothetical protein n=1 Tax=Viridibacillus sp. NPDC096237 TaxID=3390721 RepID=UPI003D030AD9